MTNTASGSYNEKTKRLPHIHAVCVFLSLSLRLTKPNTGKLQYSAMTMRLCLSCQQWKYNCFSTYFRETNEVNAAAQTLATQPTLFDFSINRKIIMDNNLFIASGDWMRTQSYANLKWAASHCVPSQCKLIMSSDEMKRLYVPKSWSIFCFVFFFSFLVETRGRLLPLHRNQRPWMRKS